MAKVYRAGNDDGTEEKSLQVRLREEIILPLLDREQADGVLLPRQTSGGGITFSLFKSDDLDSLSLLSPVQPVNAASLVSDLTFKEPSDRVAALLRPCEIRALVELEKLQQVDLDHLFIIGIDCLGTCESDEYKELLREENEALDDQYQTEMRRGSIESIPLRDACRFCGEPEPLHADVKVALVGSEEGELLLEAGSEEGEDFLSGLNLEEASLPDRREELLEEIRDRRKEQWQEEADEFRDRIDDINGLIEVLDLCRGCYNCRSACPICYCRECVFTTITFEHEGRKYIEWAERKGSIKMPTDTLLFHLTRLNHMGLSCVACGQCESACPVGISLLKIFKLIGEEAQGFFSYLPGESVDEPLPLTTYEEEEDFENI